MPPLAGIHPVREALRAGNPLEHVLIAKGLGGPRIQELIELCRQRKIPVRFEARAQLDRAAQSAAHQGVVAIGAAERYTTLEQSTAGRGLHVVLDGIEDPHNLGAIVRTAHAAGAAAVVIPERRAAGLTETVARTSAGALAYLPVVRVPSHREVLEWAGELRGDGVPVQVVGTDERGPVEIAEQDLTGPTVLAVGNETHGLSAAWREACDRMVRIPITGAVSSLNAASAASVALYEAARQRRSV